MASSEGRGSCSIFGKGRRHLGMGPDNWGGAKALGRGKGRGGDLSRARVHIPGGCGVKVRDRLQGWRCKEMTRQCLPCVFKALFILSIIAGRGCAQSEMVGRVESFEKELAKELKMDEFLPGETKVPGLSPGLSPGTGAAEDERGSTVASLPEGTRKPPFSSFDFTPDRAREPRTVIGSKEAFDALREMKKYHYPPGLKYKAPPIETFPLEEGIRREDVAFVRLNSLSTMCHKNIPTCPSFGPCRKAACRKAVATCPFISVCHSDIYSRMQRPGLEGCRKGGEEEGRGSAVVEGAQGSCGGVREPGPKSLTVFELWDTFVSHNGLTFNRSMLFSRSGCVRDKPFSYPKGHNRMVRIDTGVSILYNHGIAYFHNLIEVLPTLITIAPFLQADPGFPLVMKCSQWLFYIYQLKPFLGIPETDMNVVCVEHLELLHVKRLLQPLFPDCGWPTKDVYDPLRRQFLVHPDGVPMFGPGWQFRGQRPLSDEEMRRLPPDWVVVLGRRPGIERSIVGVGRILAFLQRMFGRERVLIFDGKQSMLAVRAAFNRAALYVGPHGAGMSTIIFMPSDSFVLEIRPRNFTNPVYHELAKACSVNYHHLWGEGDKHSKIQIDIDVVLDEIQKIFNLMTRTGMPLSQYMSSTN